MCKGYKRNQTLTHLNKKLEKVHFISQHKGSIKDFTRNRTLTFVMVFMLIFRKSIKSLQLTLNELWMNNVIPRRVSSSAYTQARKKLRHTAFIELNEDVVGIYYSDDDIKRWKNYRCFGIDGSKIILPPSEEIKKEFGEIKIKNQYITDMYVGAMFECCYDVLNHIAVKGILAPGSSYEVNLASELLDMDGFLENDLFIFDRGYASYEMLAKLTHQSKNYIVRCPKNSFKTAKFLFDKIGTWSKVVSLTVPKDQKKTILEKELPTEIKVRFVSVILSTGEVEVLATSLIDESIDRDEFKHLYYLRWGVECFFSLIKGRLNLENFTGKTLESVKQDFWSTILVTNVESIFTEEIEADINMNLRSEQLNKKINHAVSFNAIKHMAFDLFYEKDVSQSLRKLIVLFKTNTLVQRSDRSPPRTKASSRRSYNFSRRTKKQVF